MFVVGSVCLGTNIASSSIAFQYKAIGNEWIYIEENCLYKNVSKAIVVTVLLVYVVKLQIIR